MTNYTPGPWVIDDQSLVVAEIEREYGHEFPPGTLRIDAPSQERWGLASVIAGTDDKQPEFEDHRSVEVGFANARLIAAAPDMFEALEAAEHWLSEEAESPEPGATKPDEILRVIGAALAKARG